ncbi:hypothetical protein HYP06_gp042 [Vibrio phage vB_VspP_pVa5]|uniref:Uncharacterized protein n=1 Tax=Vibrio phage vB_VspP_pVa5 TaxID=1913109 RepID=A0A1J0GV88_9CAUD|nr:hypothetical protein HYP06_gp042 [Vibrio phage vB_VspP_pVa5]APC46092.1 hypothetical protein vBVspPpVa5_0042 [Vibrio phage vB_VspP_pVa5]
MTALKTEVRKDACGQEVKVGDLVVYIQPKYNELVEGYIMKFTPLGFSMSRDQGGKFACNRKTSQVVKLPVELRLERILEG